MPDQERDDPHGDVESLRRAFDEDVVDLDLAKEPDERDSDEHDGNRPERDRVERGADHSVTSAGLRRRLPDRSAAAASPRATAATVPTNVATMEGAMIAVGLLRAGRRKHADHRRRNELHAGGRHRQERDHRIGGRVLVGIERLELLHRLDAERRRGVVETEHVRGDRDHDRAGRRVIGRALRETAGAAAAAARAPRSETRPAASATRIIPSHSVMMPTSPMAICTAVDADSIAPRVTPSTVPLNAATTRAIAIRPNQM